MKRTIIRTIVRHPFIGLLLLTACCSLLTSSCATLSITNESTTDEKARAVVSDALDSIDVGLTGAATYVALHPEKRSMYQTQILPLLSMSCDIAGDAITEGRTGATPNASRYAMMISKYVIQTAAIIASWKAQEPVRVPMRAGPLPTWDQLELRKNALQARITAEQSLKTKR